MIHACDCQDEFNPLVAVATSTVHSTSGSMHKRVNFLFGRYSEISVGPLTFTLFTGLGFLLWVFWEVGGGGRITFVMTQRKRNASN